ncbi:VOC family protein [bacterium]|nr:VOC family protein [bacterium]
MNNKICWWEICTPDAGALVEFYSKAFGWETKAIPEMNYSTVMSGGSEPGGIDGGVFSPQPGQEIPPYLTLYIAVDDVDAMAAKVREFGATLVCEPMDIPRVGRIVMINDPQGHMVGLIQPEKQD